MARAARTPRPRRQSMVPNEVLQSVDALERKLILGLAVFGLGLSTLFIFVNQTGYKKDPSKLTNGVCADGWELFQKTCRQAYTMTFKEYIWQFLAVLIGSLVLAVAGWRKKRVLAAFVGLMMGLMLSTVGLPFLMLGGWLFLRAWRLQRYGVAGFVASNQAARQQALERRGQRPAKGRAATATSGDETMRRAPKPNKRYTPKKPNGSRR